MNVYNRIEGNVGGPLLTFSIFSFNAARDVALYTSDDADWLFMGRTGGFVGGDPLSLCKLDEPLDKPLTEKKNIYIK